MPELTILMPCLDEAETLQVCVDKATGYLHRQGIDGEVLIADNGSTDGSQAIAIAAGARVVDVPTRGYGAALIAGIAAARGRYIIMGDADGSYDFSAIDRFVDRLRAGDDLVMGNRFAGGIEPGAMPPLHKYLGNPVLSGVGRLLFKAPVKDFHCGLRGFSRTAALDLRLRATGMEFASEMVVKAVLGGLRISEVPTSLSQDGRSRPPHLRSWRDGWRHLRFLLLYSPRWLFLYPGLALFLAGGLGACGLFLGPVEVGPLRLGAGALVAAGVLCVIGFQAVLFACLAKVYGQAEGFLPEDRRFNRVFRYATLETGLVASFVLLVAGAGATALALSAWRSSGWGQDGAGRATQAIVPGALGLILGSQMLLSSFFLSIIGIRHTEATPPEVPGRDRPAAPRLARGSDDDEVRRKPERAMAEDAGIDP